MSVAQFKWISQMRVLHLRRQSSNKLTSPPDQWYSAICCLQDCVILMLLSVILSNLICLGAERHRSWAYWPLLLVFCGRRMQDLFRTAIRIGWCVHGAKVQKNPPRPEVLSCLSVIIYSIFPAFKKIFMVLTSGHYCLLILLPVIVFTRIITLN